MLIMKLKPADCYRKMGKTVSLILPHIHMMFQLRGYGFLVGYNNFVGSLQVVSQ